MPSSATPATPLVEIYFASERGQPLYNRQTDLLLFSGIIDQLTSSNAELLVPLGTTNSTIQRHAFSTGVLLPFTFSPSSSDNRQAAVAAVTAGGCALRTSGCGPGTCGRGHGNCGGGSWSSLYESLNGIHDNR